MTATIDERRARMLLSLWSEAADEDLVSQVRARGPERVVNELLSGESRLRRARAMALRIGEATRNIESLAAPLEERAERCGARFIVPGDAEWPSQLDDLSDRCPLGLWVAGAANLRALAAFSTAVVGARAATPYGEAPTSEEHHERRRNTTTACCRHSYLQPLRDVVGAIVAVGGRAEPSPRSSCRRR